MLFILPKEILGIIIDYLPFDDALNIFKIDSIKILFDRTIRDQKLYRALFLKVTSICGCHCHDAAIDYIEKHGNIDACKQEIFSIMKKGLKPNYSTRLSLHLQDIGITIEPAYDDVIWYVAKKPFHLGNGKYKKLRDKISATFNWYVYRILEKQNPYDISFYMFNMDEFDKENLESYMDGTIDILSLDYKCKK